MKNANQYAGRFMVSFVGLFLLSLTASAQLTPDTRTPGQWAAEVNVLRPFVPGILYNGKLLRQVGAFVGDKVDVDFGTKIVRPYLNLQPLGFLYRASQSNPHSIVGQTSEGPIYAGTVQVGIDF